MNEYNLNGFGLGGTDPFDKYLSPIQDEGELDESLDDDYFEQFMVQDNPVNDKMGAGEAGIRGFGQGLTFGTEDEIRGGVIGTYDWITGEGSLSDNYTRNRDKIRALNEKASKDQFGAYLAGDVAGGITTGVLAAPLTGGSSTVAAAARTAAIQGAAMGWGYSDADNATDIAKDTAIGGGVGGILGAGGKKLSDRIGNISENAGKRLQGRGESNTARVLGSESLGLSENESKRLGRLALDMDMLKTATPDGIKEAVLSETDKFIKSMTNEHRYLSRNYRSKLVELLPDNVTELRNTLDILDAGTPKYIAVSRMIDKIDSGNYTHRDAVSDLSRLARISDFGNPNPSTVSTIAREEFAMVGKITTDTAAVAADEMFKKAVKDGISEEEAFKYFYETHLASQQHLDNLLNLVQTTPNIAEFGAKKLVSEGGALTDTLSNLATGITGGGLSYLASGEITDDPLLQGILAAGAAYGSTKASPYATQAANRIVTSVATKGFDKAGKMLQKAENLDPNNLGRFGKILNRAKENGSHSYNVTFQALLNQNPEFREMVRGNSDEPIQ